MGASPELTSQIHEPAYGRTLYGETSGSLRFTTDETFKADDIALLAQVTSEIVAESDRKYCFDLLKDALPDAKGSAKTGFGSYANSPEIGRSIRESHDPAQKLLEVGRDYALIRLRIDQKMADPVFDKFLGEEGNIKFDNLNGANHLGRPDILMCEAFVEERHGEFQETIVQLDEILSELNNNEALDSWLEERDEQEDLDQWFRDIETKPVNEQVGQLQALRQEFKDHEEQVRLNDELAKAEERSRQENVKAELARNLAKTAAAELAQEQAETETVRDRANIASEKRMQAELRAETAAAELAQEQAETEAAKTHADIAQESLKRAEIDAEIVKTHAARAAVDAEIAIDLAEIAESKDMRMAANATISKARTSIAKTIKALAKEVTIHTRIQTAFDAERLALEEQRTDQANIQRAQEAEYLALDEARAEIAQTRADREAALLQQEQAETSELRIQADRAAEMLLQAKLKAQAYEDTYNRALIDDVLKHLADRPHFKEFVNIPFEAIHEVIEQEIDERDNFFAELSNEQIKALLAQDAETAGELTDEQQLESLTLLYEYFYPDDPVPQPEVEPNSVTDVDHADDDFSSEYEDGETTQELPVILPENLRTAPVPVTAPAQLTDIIDPSLTIIDYSMIEVHEDTDQKTNGDITTPAEVIAESENDKRVAGIITCAEIINYLAYRYIEQDIERDLPRRKAPDPKTLLSYINSDPNIRSVLNEPVFVEAFKRYNGSGKQALYRIGKALSISLSDKTGYEKYVLRSPSRQEFLQIHNLVDIMHEIISTREQNNPATSVKGA